MNDETDLDDGEDIDLASLPDDELVQQMHDDLFEAVVTHTLKPEFCFDHSWAENDLVLWDNRRTLHYATGFPVDDDRMIQRATLAGLGRRLGARCRRGEPGVRKIWNIFLLALSTSKQRGFIGFLVQWFEGTPWNESTGFLSIHGYPPTSLCPSG